MSFKAGLRIALVIFMVNKNFNFFQVLLSILSLFFCFSTQAKDLPRILAYSDDALLSDSQGPSLVHPISAEPVMDAPVVVSERASTPVRGQRSDLLAIAPYITDVKHQSQRNLCTIFVMNALYETAYLQNNRNAENADLSEEWLQYLNSIVSESGGGQGSYMQRNYTLAQQYGLAGESKWPYDGKLWDANHPKAKKFCDDLSGMNLTRCLNGHRSPLLIKQSEASLRDPESPHFDLDFAETKTNAQQIRRLMPYTGEFVSSVSTIKSLLDRGVTLSMEIDIFYESWNHSRGKSLGMSPDEVFWKRGIVTYPEQGSLDRVVSPTEPARHAVQIVAYDDDYEITYEKKMTDGTSQSFTRKGVYIFKNSWGTKNFGSRFTYDGNQFRGFGMILQDYAHEEGQFFYLKSPGLKGTR